MTKENPSTQIKSESTSEKSDALPSAVMPLEAKEKKVLMLLFALLIVSVTLAFSTMFNEVFIIPKRFFLRLFTSVIFIYWLSITLRRVWSWISPAAVLACIAFFSVTVISTIFSIFPPLGIDTILDQLCLVLLFLVVTSSFTREDILGMIRWITFSAVIVAIYSLVQHAGWDPVGWVQEKLVRTRTISTLGNPDFLSAFLVMAIPLVFVKACMSTKKVESFGYIALWGFLCMINILTYSRAGFVAMLVGMAVAALLMGKKIFFRRRTLTIMLVILLLLSLLAVFAFEMSGKGQLSLLKRLSAFTNMSENNVATRLYLWKAALLIFEEHPIIGTGPNTFDITYLKYRYMEPFNVRLLMASPGSAHNLFLDIAISSGILGLSTFLFFLLVVARDGARFFRKRMKRGEAEEDSSDGDEPDTNFLFAAGMSAGLIAFLTAHLAGFSTLPTDVVFWILAGLCLVAFASKKETPVNPMVKRDVIPLPRLLLLVFTLIGGVFFIYRTATATAADYYFGMGRAYQSEITEKRPAAQNVVLFEKSLENYDRVIRLNPLSQNYWLFRGKLFEQFVLVNEDTAKTKDLIIQSALSYEYAIHLNPYNPYPYADLSRLLGIYTTTDDAEVKMMKAIELDPYNYTLNSDYVRLLQKRGKVKEAENCLVRSTKMNPGFMTWIDLGVFYYNQKRYDEAEEALNTGLSYRPGHRGALDYLDRIREQRNKKNKK